MITVDDIKQTLRVSSGTDDDLLTRLIASAADECMRFTGLTEINSSSNDDLLQGMAIMVQADYDANPQERVRYRNAAETLWMPYRDGLGV